jgi:hypothetical protein
MVLKKRLEVHRGRLCGTVTIFLAKESGKTEMWAAFPQEEELRGKNSLPRHESPRSFAGKRFLSEHGDRTGAAAARSQWQSSLLGQNDYRKFQQQQPSASLVLEIPHLHNICSHTSLFDRQAVNKEYPEYASHLV